MDEIDRVDSFEQLELATRSGCMIQAESGNYPAKMLLDMKLADVMARIKRGLSLEG